VAKCQGPRAGGGPLGPPTSELKALKIYLPAKYNYKKKYILRFLYIMEIFNNLLSLVHLIDDNAKNVH
jgi:hypothetical protein